MATALCQCGFAGKHFADSRVTCHSPHFFFTLIEYHTEIRLIDQKDDESVQVSKTCFTKFRRWTHLSSLIALILRRRSKLNYHPSTTRTYLTSNLILLYPQHFRVLLSAGSTPTSFCLQKQHTTLLTSVCEHPEPTRAVYFCPSTNTFMVDNFLGFTCLRRLALTSPPLGHLPWHSDVMCPSPLHVFHTQLCNLSESPCIQSFTIWLGSEH